MAAPHGSTTTAAPVRDAAGGRRSRPGLLKTGLLKTGLLKTGLLKVSLGGGFSMGRFPEGAAPGEAAEARFIAGSHGR
jgi:hypothetical protein